MAALAMPEPKAAITVDPSESVTRRVLSELGTPKNLFRVETKPLWADHFRVNVLCWLDTERSLRTLAVTDSFFVTTTSEGILSDPPITRKYAR